MRLRGIYVGLVAGAVVLGATGSVLASGVSLPFFDGFESYTMNAALPTNLGVWATSGSAPAVAVTNSPVAELAKACNARAGKLLLPVDQGLSYTNVWLQFFMYASPCDDLGGASHPVVDSSSVAQFYVSTSGVLRAYVSYGSSNAWTNVVTVTTGAWLGVAMHIDYHSRLWDLYTTAGAYGSVLHKANALPLVMQTAAASVIKFGDVTFQAPASLDAVGLSLASGNPSGASPTNAASQRFTGKSTNMVGILASNYGNGIASTLAGTLGSDLASALHDGDQIKLYYTNDWNQYKLINGVWSKTADYAMCLDPSNMVINPGMGVWVISTNQTNGVLVQAYGTLPSFTNTVYGTNNATMRGWNMLAWPYPKTQSAAAGWGFAPATAGLGDKMYVYQGGGYVNLWWDNTSKCWRQGASVSTYPMQGGQAFWYYRAGTSIQWIVTSP